MSKNAPARTLLSIMALGLSAGIFWHHSYRLYKEKQAKKRLDSAISSRLAPPQPGDILLFYRPKLWRDRVIQTVTGSRFYHAALYRTTEDGHRIVVEARPKGVIISDLKGREDAYIIVPSPEGRGAPALAWAETQLGSPYDPRDAFVIGLEHVFKHWRINYTMPGKYSCGELVAAAYEKAGVCLVPGKNASEAAPGDIAVHLARALIDPLVTSEGR